MTERNECLKCHFYTGNDCGECEGQEEPCEEWIPWKYLENSEK